MRVNARVLAREKERERERERELCHMIKIADHVTETGADIERGSFPVKSFILRCYSCIAF